MIAATNASDENLTFLKFMNHWTVLDHPLFDSIELRKLARVCSNRFMTRSAPPKIPYSLFGPHLICLCHAFRVASDKQIIKLIGGYNLSDLPASRPAMTKFHPKASHGRAE